MTNILVTGRNGQLGSEIHALASKYESYKFIFTDLEELDITNSEDVSTFFNANSINAVINCAAYTAVDKAESDEQKAIEVNQIGVSNLVKACLKFNAKLIHISTDYVYDGMNFRPYLETDPTSPKGVYGVTKLEGEKELFNQKLKNSIIIRTSWVYSSYGNNFVKTMIKLSSERKELGVISDQVGTPTYARDLAQSILTILPKVKNDSAEIFHYSNEGVASWYDFAKAIFEIKKIDIKLNPIGTHQYPTAAERPHYSVLNKGKIKDKFGLDIPYWKDALKDCLNKM